MKSQSLPHILSPFKHTSLPGLYIEFCVQDLKNEAASYAKQSSESTKAYSQQAQKEALNKLSSSQSLASKKLQSLKKEADAKYKDALVSPPHGQLLPNMSRLCGCDMHNPLR